MNCAPPRAAAIRRGSSIEDFLCRRANRRIEQRERNLRRLAGAGRRFEHRDEDVRRKCLP